MAVRQEAFHTLLRDHGFTDARAATASHTLARADEVLAANAAGRVTVWAPGRIEVFGKHTDYAGGRSLLAAVERGFCVRAAPRGDREIHVTALDTGLSCSTTLAAEASAPDGHWSNYVATVARRVALNFPDAAIGADIVFGSDLPLAAGVSSSTALMVSVFLAVAALNRLHHTADWRAMLGTRPELAGYLGAMEMGGPYRQLAGLPGVGTLGGAQDQTAILCSEPDRVVDFSWMPVRRRGAYALPSDVCFIVASSGIVAEKSAGARESYNRASLMVRHLLGAWNADTGRSDGSLAAAAESAPSSHDRLRELAARRATPTYPVDALVARLEQFLLETYTLIPAAAAALEAQAWQAFGAVTARSQRAAEEWLGNQIPETSALVRLAMAHGALGASAFGAGFGGSVWALVPRERANDCRDAWAMAYRREFPEAGSRAMFFVTAAGPPAAFWHDEPEA